MPTTHKNFPQNSPSIFPKQKSVSDEIGKKKHACLLLGGGRSNISRWLTVGIEPCRGRIKNLPGSPSKLFALSLSCSLEISSQPVRNTRIAPPPSFRHIYSIVAST